ncbi:MAG: hypothetical protein NPIRA02_38710 [Nitrospirales bacterium]|nr:MAG: hypothetical protein NPIRA02_38710 [Nitrospirales bacterium]
MTLPNFLIIGAQRSGTTSLYHYLEQHPEIYMSPIKEPKFFVFDGETPQFHGSSGTDESKARYEAIRKKSITNFDDYSALFRAVSGQKAVGEASPHYLYCPRSAQRIKKHLPEVKLIVILRNPVDRAYSNFFLKIQIAERQFLENFEQAVQDEKNRRVEDIWDGGKHYIRKGFYHSHLTRYYDIFDPKQIKVYLYEDLNNHLSHLMQDIFRFLNVNESFIPDTSTRFTESAHYIAQNALENSLLVKKWPKSLARTLLPNKVRSGIKQKLMSYFKSKNQDFIKPQLPTELRQQLIEVYREDITMLQQLIQRDLSQWLEIKKN